MLHFKIYSQTTFVKYSVYEIRKPFICSAYRQTFEG